MKKIIMVVTNRYDPDVRVHKEAIYLKSIGFDVEVLCWDRENEYKERVSEVIDGVKVIRFYPYAKYGSGFKQVFSFIKFIFEIKRYLFKVKYDYLHCHDLDGIIAGIFANRKKTALIFDMHEFYEVLNNNQKYRKLVRWVVSIFQNKSDWIIYVNEAQIETINKKNSDKLIFLPNYPDVNTYNTKYKTTSDKLRISYIGSVRQYEEIKNLMDACIGMDDVIVSIHGMGVAYERLKEIIDNYPNTNLTGVFKLSELSGFYGVTDILYAVYPMENIQNKISYPVKFYEAILTNTPVIVSKSSILEEFLSNHDIGFVVDGSDIKNIRKSIYEINKNRKIISDKQLNIKQIQFDYIWESVVINLDKIYLNKD